MKATKTKAAGTKRTVTKVNEVEDEGNSGRRPYRRPRAAALENMATAAAAAENSDETEDDVSVSSDSDDEFTPK